MSGTGTIQATGQVNGLPIGYLNLNLPTISLGTAVGQVTPTNLAAGNNAIAVPAGSTYFIFVPPAANANALLLKKVNGDTGFELHKTYWSVIAMDVANTAFVINAAALTNGCEVTWL